MVDFAIWFGITAAGIWTMVLVFLLFQERRLIFMPSRAVAAAPTDLGLEFEKLSIPAPDGVKLHGWWIKGRGGPVVIWYHGSAGNVGDRLQHTRWLVDHLGVDVVLVDYRGYGLSTGTPDETGVYQDGLAIYDAVVERGIRPEDIVLFGRSLGGAIAIETALHRPVAALVLECAFRSIRAMAQEFYWYMPTWLVRTRMDNEAKIGNVHAPTLVLHGDRDALVPPAHGRRIFERAGHPAAFHLVEGAGHNNTWRIGGPRYAEAWRKFLKAFAGPPIAPSN